MLYTCTKLQITKLRKKEKDNMEIETQAGAGQIFFFLLKPINTATFSRHNVPPGRQLGAGQSVTHREVQASCD